MSQTQPYVNDALRYAAIEVRFAPLDDLVSPIVNEFRDRIRGDLVVSEQEQQVTLNLGPAGPSTQQTLRQRFSTRDRITSAVLGRDILILETTDYPGWSEFRDRFMRLIAGLEDVRRPDGILRVGIRYIDEIRVPGLQRLRDWSHWISESLMAPLLLDPDNEPSGATLALQYGAAPGFVTLFRAAPFSEGQTVQAEGPLRLPYPTIESPYFLLDTDASWADPNRIIPEFTGDLITAVLDELHAPCVRLFEASLTDRLRNDVLRRPRDEVWSSHDA